DGRQCDDHERSDDHRCRRGACGHRDQRASGRLRRGERSMSSFSVGEVIAERTLHLTRDSLVRYAGASGDFNPIHYRDDVAASVGLPGVLAHGMLTMGIASSVVIAALGDSSKVTDYGVRFTRPVVVD